MLMVIVKSNTYIHKIRKIVYPAYSRDTFFFTQVRELIFICLHLQGHILFNLTRPIFLS